VCTSQPETGYGPQPETFQQVMALTGHTGPVNCGAFSRDGKCIVSGSDHNLVKIWDTATGAEVDSFFWSAMSVVEFFVCWEGGRFAHGVGSGLR